MLGEGGRKQELRVGSHLIGGLSVVMLDIRRYFEGIWMDKCFWIDKCLWIFIKVYGYLLRFMDIY